ncbi:MAG: histidine phosphatase family protein [Paracoccaceae bacterium]|nr:histidine phosphatase family protein [Paracoccaceae bacterium]
MRRLILMRHAKSDWGAGLEDHERPLNKRGKASAAALGGWLRRHAIVPDCVLCSSAERTGQTLFGLRLPEAVPMTFTKNLYLAEPEEMLTLLRRCEQACVLMIGHNPGIGEMAARLMDDPPEHTRFFDYPTGATLIVDFSVDSWNDIGWHKGQPIEFTVPRDLA